MHHIKKIAIVGFDFLSIKARYVVDDFNKNIPVFQITSLGDAQNILIKLKYNHYDAVIGDQITSRLANKIGINCILITSGNESVESALQNCLTLLQAKYTETKSSEILSKLLKHRDEHLVTVDKTKKISFMSNLVTSSPLLPDIKKRIQYVNWNNTTTSIFKNRNQYFQISRPLKYEQNIYIIKHLDHYHPNETVSIPYNNKANIEIFKAYLSSILSQQFLNALNIYQHSLGSIFIAGEDGSGKNELIQLISSSSKATFRIDCTNFSNSTLNDLVDSVNSPLMSEHYDLVFDHLNMLNPTLQRGLISFINDTLLYKRHKLIFNYELGTSTHTNLIKLLIKQPKYIELKPFSYLKGKQISLLISLIINYLNTQNGREILGVTDIAFDRILRTPWKRNYRQFITVINESYNATVKPYIDLDGLMYGFRQEINAYNISNINNIHSNQQKLINVAVGTSLKDSIKTIVQKELAQHNFNKTKTAKDLGISRSTLWRLLK